MKQDIPRSERLEIRLLPEEKKAFEMAAENAGISVSAWLRIRLRRLVKLELDDAGLPSPLIPKKR